MLKNKTPKILLAQSLLCSFFACVKNPQAPENQKIISGEESILVLNEGLWGRDNAVISRYDRASGLTVHNVFQQQNPGLRLGDTANSWIVQSERIYIVMNGSNTIEIVDRHDLTSLGRILLPGNPSPRNMIVVDDSIAYVTALYTDAVLRINLENGRITDEISIGPAPESIVAAAGFIFVTNSGLGDIRAAETGAGTLSIIKRDDRTEIGRIPILPNCNSMHIGPDGLLYIGGSGSWMAEKPSGIVVFDPARFAVLDTILIPHHPRDFTFDQNGAAYVITDSAIVTVSLSMRLILRLDFIPRTALSGDNYFYAIAFNLQRGELFVSNARNFTTNGEVVCFDLSGREKFRFATRILPGAILIQ